MLPVVELIDPERSQAPIAYLAQKFVSLGSLEKRVQVKTFVAGSRLFNPPDKFFACPIPMIGLGRLPF